MILIHWVPLTTRSITKSTGLSRTILFSCEEIPVIDVNAKKRFYCLQRAVFAGSKRGRMYLVLYLCIIDKFLPVKKDCLILDMLFCYRCYFNLLLANDYNSVNKQL